MKLGRYEKLSISLLRLTAWIVALSGIVFLLDYSLDVSKRRSLGSVCQWNVVPNPENYPYVARYCHLNKETTLLRLYDADGRELLAERMYFELDMARIFWTPRRLLYDTSTGGAISLPPTVLDRLRATLP